MQGDRPMRKLWKFIRNTIITLILLLIIAAAVLYISLNAILRTAIVYSAHQSLGTTVTLQSASLNLASGRLTLTNLSVANPPGYREPTLLTMGSCTIDIQLKSLTGNPIHISAIDVDNVNVALEQKGLDNNLSDVLKHSNSSQNSTSNSPGLDIGHLLITNAVIRLNADQPFTPGSPLGVGAPLKRIEMDHPTSSTGGPIRAADLVGQIVAQLAKEIATNPEIPQALQQTIGQSSGLISNFVNSSEKGVGGVVHGIESLFGHHDNSNQGQK